MGQEIVYCFKCQSRLVSADFEKQAAVRVGVHPACKACVPALAPVAASDSAKASSSSSRMPLPRNAEAGPNRMPLILGAAVGFVIGGVALLSGQRPLPSPPSSREPIQPEPIVIPAPRPQIPLELGPAVERETKAAESRRDLGDPLLALREEIRLSFLREEFKRCLDIVEGARSRKADPRWSNEIDQLLSEIRGAAPRIYGPLKERAVLGMKSGDTAAAKAACDRVAKWELEGYAQDLARALAEAAPPPPVSPPPVASPEAQAYLLRWESAAGQARGRDYEAALSTLAAALGTLKSADQKAEAARDAEAFRLAQSVLSEAAQIPTQWTVDQKIALRYYDETGQPRSLEGTIARLEASRVTLRAGGGLVTVELGELAPGWLASQVLERRKRSEADLRAASFFSALEGDPEGISGGSGLPEKYALLARRLAEDRTAAGSPETKARNLYFSAESSFPDFTARADAVLRYRDLLRSMGETTFVRRNRVSISQRADSGKEFFFFPPQLSAGGSFKHFPDLKSDGCWMSNVDTSKERLKENYVQLGFSVLPDVTYKCWIYAGGCCLETLACSFQVVDPVPEERKGSGDDLPQPLKVAFSAPRTHSSHGGPKLPTRWGWIPVGLPKFSTAGPIKVRILANQQGFALGYAVVSAGRQGPPSDAELKKMERPPSEPPLNAGLEAWWKCDEGKGTVVSDSSGKGIHGKFIRSVQWTEGKFGGAVRFERDNYIFIPHVESLSFRATDSFSVSLWINLPSVEGGARAIFAKSRDQAPYYGLWVTNGKWVFGGSGKCVEGGPATTGWHHVVLVQNGSTRERLIYVDGAKTGAGQAQDANGVGELRIGAAKSVSEYLSGTVDDVRVYSRALSPAEIGTLGQTP